MSVGRVVVLARDLVIGGIVGLGDLIGRCCFDRVLERGVCVVI